MRRYFVFLFFSIFLLMSCGRDQDDHVKVLPSPGFDIHLYFNLYKGIPFYLVYFHDDIVVNWSSLGFTPEGEAKFNENMIPIDPDHNDLVRIEDNPEGFFNDVRFNSLVVQLVSSVDSSVKYAIEFRSFEGGFAFRYRFEESGDMMKLRPWEASEFNFLDPGRIIQNSMPPDSTELAPSSYDLPLELITGKSHRIQIAEYAEPGFPGMKLKHEAEEDLRFTASIDNSHDIQGHTTTLSTPWRIVLISKNIPNE